MGREKREEIEGGGRKGGEDRLEKKEEFGMRL